MWMVSEYHCFCVKILSIFRIVETHFMVLWCINQTSIPPTPWTHARTMSRNVCTQFVFLTFVVIITQLLIGSCNWPYFVSHTSTWLEMSVHSASNTQHSLRIWNNVHNSCLILYVDPRCVCLVTRKTNCLVGLWWVGIIGPRHSRLLQIVLKL